MQSQLKKTLRVFILLMLGGASFTLVLSGCVTYYGKEPNRYTYPRESVPPPVEESPVIAEPAAPIPVFPQPPLMAWDSRFGMYFAIGSPSDLFFYGGSYYVFANSGWYRSVYYNGPWLYTERVVLPPVFHSHRLEDLRQYREGIYREYRKRPNTFRERIFDHRVDRFRDQYDRRFMERNREQMRRDREYYAHHESRTNRIVPERHDPSVGNHEPLAGSTVPERHEPSVGNHEPLAGSTVPERHEPSVGNHEPLAGSTVPERHEPSVGNHEPLAGSTVPERHEPSVGNHEPFGLKQVKRPLGKPPAQKMVQKKKPAPKKTVDKPEEKK